MNATAEPSLAPPGAGLPALEHFLARFFFRLRRWTGSREAFTAKFHQQRAAIRALIEPCDASTGAQRVIIDRVRGLEDSSRYWSVWMTLDHLRIVHLEMAKVIAALLAGKVPPGQANTATVKPSPTADASVVAEYEASCDLLLATATAAPTLHTSARFPHPWFGPLSASDWYALAGGHMGIHRTQIERILAGTNRSYNRVSGGSALHTKS